ncbi:MAG: hypothetical protein ACXWV9_06115 [Flavisolibacter sp.]
MKMTGWFAILFSAAVIACCFFPWVHIQSRNILIGGIYSDLNTFGKPGLLHCFFAGLTFLLLLINKIWSLRTAFFSSVINLAWALRNFLLIPACSGGECPVKLPALYVLLISSVLVIVLILLIRPRENAKRERSV